MIDKMLNEMWLKAATEDANKAVNQVVINIELKKNEQSGLYKYKTRIRMCKLKDPQDISAGHVFKVDTYIENSMEYSNKKLVQAAKRDLATCLIIYIEVLYGKERLEKLTEAMIRGIFGGKKTFSFRINEEN